MQGGWLIGCMVATGCGAFVDAGPPVLRVEPAAIDLDVDLALPPPTAAIRVFALGLDGREADVTAAATLRLDGAALGSLGGAGLTSDGVTGGVATIQITYEAATAAIPAAAHVHGRRVVDGTPAGAVAAFAAAARTPFDAQLDPPDGAVIPSGLGRMVLGFVANDLDNAHEVRVTAPELELVIVAPGVAGPRTIELAPREWSAIARTARGGQIQLEVASLRSTAPAVARVATVGLDLADLDPSALLVSGVAGVTGPVTDVDRPSLWRYDMHAGSVASMFRNPAGACIGCHLAVSPDGARIAALIVSPTAPLLNGVVVDARAGTVLAQSDGASATPWATAAFDPKTGALLAAWQGGLALRDAATGAVLAPIAMTEPAAAPAISPDGAQLAYVTLDAGLGAAASQPAGNALHARPWSAAQRAVGPPIELYRDHGGVVLPAFSSDGRWVAFGHSEILPDRVNEVPLGSSAVRSDGSRTIVKLTSDPLDRLAHFASPVAPVRAGNRAPEPMVWVAMISNRPVGGNATASHQLWLEAFYPERGLVTPAFHLPGQPATLQILHGPIALP